jgi:hypothetical protein
MNKSVEKILRGVESDLHKAPSHFAADKVINSSMDIFYKNPSHQMSISDNLNGSYEVNIEISTLKSCLTVSPIFAENGEQLGTVVEWLDTAKALQEWHTTTGIDEIGKAVTQMDEVTQQNAVLVEEAYAVAESLQSQALQLTERVALFKTNDSQESPHQLTSASKILIPIRIKVPAPRHNKPALSRRRDARNKIKPASPQNDK